MKPIVPICCLIIALPLSHARAAAKLPAIFGDHMVLQQGAKLPVWGWADPNETIKVFIAGQEQSVKADGNGHWRVTFEQIQSQQPLEMKVVASNTITVH